MPMKSRLPKREQCPEPTPPSELAAALSAISAADSARRSKPDLKGRSRRHRSRRHPRRLTTRLRALLLSSSPPRGGGGGRANALTAYRPAAAAADNTAAHPRGAQQPATAAKTTAGAVDSFCEEDNADALSGGEGDSTGEGEAAAWLPCVIPVTVLSLRPL